MGRSWVTKTRTTPGEISQAITSTVSDINNVRIQRQIVILTRESLEEKVLIWMQQVVGI